MRRTFFLILFLIVPMLIAASGTNGAARQYQASPVVVSPDSDPSLPVFVKHDGPVFSGQYVASDPAIVQEAGFLRLFYTCFIVPDGPFDPSSVRAAICSATSIDGLSWIDVDTGDTQTPGLVLRGREGSWEANLEASFAIEIEGTWLLYYSGYETEGSPALGFPAKLSVATSKDGIHFERASNDPILSPTPGWYDNDAVYSPAIAIAGDRLVMVYAGHCYTKCDYGYNVTLLGATSTDGFNWTKLDQPVLQGPALGLGWTRDGVAEPALLYGPDNVWRLFFTSVAGADRMIGLATGPSPFGPWTVLDQPVLQPTPGTFDEGGVLAPWAMIDENQLRMWYLGQSIGEQQLAIGYAEAPFPGS